MYDSILAELISERKARKMENNKASVEFCLKDYLSRIPWGSKGASKACRSIMSATGVRSQGTIRRWFTGTIKPVGETLILLRYFLEEQNYRVSELDNLDHRIRNLGFLIYKGLVTWEDAVKMLGFSNMQSLYRLLHGEGSTSNSKLEEIEKICRLHNVALLPESKTETSAHKPNTASGIDMKLVFNLIAVSKALAQAFKPVLEQFLSGSENLRTRFRQEVGNGLFETSNLMWELAGLLNALCSETARKQYYTKNNKK